MNKNILITPAVPLLSLLLPSCASQAHRGTPSPNIIYIYADDMGVGDIGCYGQQYIKTPNIDRIAEEGVRFTQHYTGAPISAPARCCLLTGKHSGHAYVRNNLELHDSSAFKTGQLPLPGETVTIAKLLKRSGYATAAIGKWGLGSIESSGNPNRQGFDLFYGYADQVHAHNHYPSFLWRNSEQVFLENNVPTVHPKYDKAKGTDIREEYAKYMGTQYSLDLMTEEALNFIDANKEKPFFLYIPYVVPHKALQVPDESLEMYDGVFEEETYDGRNGYTPHPRPRSAYAAMISRMDRRIGDILDHLRKLGLDDNTIVMFSSDNGPAGGGGLDTRFFNSTAGLRGSKSQVYEGGIRVPFVARWPGRIPPGTVTTHLSAQYDLMATLAEVAGQKVTGTDGVSFLPTLLGKNEKQKQHEYLYWEFSDGNQYAVRIGHMKGVKSKKRGDTDSKWEVYNILEDERENNDIAGEHPELIQQFEEIIRKRTPSHIPRWNF